MRFLVFFFTLLAETQDGKTIEQKRKGYDDEKKKIPRFPSFRFRTIEFFFTSIFGKIKNQKMT